MNLKIQCKNFPSKFCPEKSLKFIDKYKFNVEYDKKYFGNIDIFNCEQCQICFAQPMPDNKTLDDYYGFIYRAKNRPHDIDDECPPSILKSRLEILEKKIDLSNIKNVLEIGAGNGAFGKLLKDKHNINIFCIEPDSFVRDVLSNRGYKFFDEKKDVETKFDLILSFHSLEHFNSMENFFNLFEKVLNKNSTIFIEVPNNPVDKWFKSRPYDSPHTLFFSKKGLEKIFTDRKFDLIFSDYIGPEIEEVFKHMQISKKNFGNWSPEKSYFIKRFKKKIKSLLPLKLLEIKRSMFKNKRNNFYDFNYGNDNSWCLRILAKK